MLAVTVADRVAQLREHAARIFRTWRSRLAELLEQAGLEPSDAASFAATLIASCEGAVALSRAEQSLEPFDLVADQLMRQVRVLARPRRARPARTQREGAGAG